MSRLLYSAAMSLDGFIAGADGDMSWLTEHMGDPDLDSGDHTADIGALLIGRRTFTGDDPNAGTDAEGPYGGTWQGPSIVLTHDPPQETTDTDVVFVSDLATAVRTAKEAAGGKYVSILGANVAAQCLEAGVLDEILVFVTPVLLGDGTRLFEHAGGTNVRLERIHADGMGASALRFRVVR